MTIALALSPAFTQTKATKSTSTKSSVTSATAKNLTKDPQKQTLTAQAAYIAGEQAGKTGTKQTYKMMAEIAKNPKIVTISNTAYSVPSDFSKFPGDYAKGFVAGFEAMDTEAYNKGYAAGKISPPSSSNRRVETCPLDNEITIPSTYVNHADNYRAGFKKGWDDIDKEAYQKGLAAGKAATTGTLAASSIPQAYQSHTGMYKKGYTTAWNNLENEAYTKGKEAGSSPDATSATISDSSVPTDYKNHKPKYKEGYTEGWNNLENEAFTEGNIAGKATTANTATITDSKVPYTYRNHKQKYKDGYTEGWNTMETEAYNKGYEAGKTTTNSTDNTQNVADSKIPDSYTYHKAKYKEGYKIGWNEIDQKAKDAALTKGKADFNESSFSYSNNVSAVTTPVAYAAHYITYRRNYEEAYKKEAAPVIGYKEGSEASRRQNTQTSYNYFHGASDEIYQTYQTRYDAGKNETEYEYRDGHSRGENANFNSLVLSSYQHFSDAAYNPSELLSVMQTPKDARGNPIPTGTAKYRRYVAGFCDGALKSIAFHNGYYITFYKNARPPFVTVGNRSSNSASDYGKFSEEYTKGRTDGTNNRPVYIETWVKPAGYKAGVAYDGDTPPNPMTYPRNTDYMYFSSDYIDAFQSGLDVKKEAKKQGYIAGGNAFIGIRGRDYLPAKSSIEVPATYSKSEQPYKEGYIEGYQEARDLYYEGYDEGVKGNVPEAPHNPYESKEAPFKNKFPLGYKSGYAATLDAYKKGFIDGADFGCGQQQGLRDIYDTARPNYNNIDLPAAYSTGDKAIKYKLGYELGSERAIASYRAGCILGVNYYKKTIEKTATYTRRAPAAPSPHGDVVIQETLLTVADKYRIGYESGWDYADNSYIAGRNAGDAISRGVNPPDVPVYCANPGLLNDIYKLGKEKGWQ